MQTTLNTTSSGTAPSSGGITSALGGSPSDLFTTLLVAQIRNQNPLEPTDPAEFVGQLTQLSQMEALQRLVGQGSASASMLESLQVLTLGAQVGSNVAVRSDAVTLAGTPVQGRFTLASASSEVALVLRGVGGAEHRIELGTRAAGDVLFEIDSARAGIPPGTYALSVETASSERPAIDVFGELKSVRLAGDGRVALNVANLGEVSALSITGFNGRTTLQPR